MKRSSGSSGFTLIELMIVVLILGLLAAIAVPTFLRYVRRSRSTEAITNIQRIYSAQYTYNSEIHERGLSGSFVNAPATPSAPPGASRYAANSLNWTGQAQWLALGFALDAGHFYQYSSPGNVTGFTARAVGDLDGDGVRSTFSRAGLISEGEIQGGAMNAEDELE